MILHHITLLTGDTAIHRLDILDPAAVAACRSLLPAGGPVPGFPAYRVTISGPLYTIWRGREPIATGGVGHGAQDTRTWQAVAELQAQVAPVKATHPPATAAWLAVALLPGLAHLTRQDIGWLGDFERCMAAALLLPAAG